MLRFFTPTLAALLLLLLNPADVRAYTELDDSNFDSFTRENDHTLVVFYAPWAEAWEKFEEEFEVLEEEMEDKYPEVQLGLCDIEENKKLSRFSGKNTVAMKFFWGSKYYNNNQPSSSPPITYFGSLYATSVFNFLEVVMDTMLTVSLEDVDPIVEEFMKITFSMNGGSEAVGKQPELRDKIKALLQAEKAKAENVRDAKRQRLLHLHIQVMTELMEGSQNLSRNLHLVGQDLATNGMRMQLHEYQGKKQLLLTYEQYADAALPPDKRKGSRAGRGKLDEVERKTAEEAERRKKKKKKVEIGADGSARSALS